MWNQTDQISFNITTYICDSSITSRSQRIYVSRIYQCISKSELLILYKRFLSRFYNIIFWLSKREKICKIEQVNENTYTTIKLYEKSFWLEIVRNDRKIKKEKKNWERHETSREHPSSLPRQRRRGTRRRRRCFLLGYQLARPIERNLSSVLLGTGKKRLPPSWMPFGNDLGKRILEDPWSFPYLLALFHLHSCTIRC